MSRKSRVLPDIIDIMHNWARYMVDPPHNNGWPRQVTLGKLLDGMPGTDCPRCKDAVTGASVGFIHITAPGIAAQKVECPVCFGARRAKLDHSPNKANPVLIRGNGSRYGFDDDPISQKVDKIVCTCLTETQKSVIIITYTGKGKQTWKAHQLKISQSYFSEILGKAHEIITKRLYSC